MNEAFINVYIEIMAKRIEDLIKSDMMLNARLVLAERLVASLADEKEKLTVEIARLNDLVAKQEQTPKSRKKSIADDEF